MLKTPLRVLPATLLLALAACAHSPAAPDTTVEQAAVQAAPPPNASPRELALAGFRAYLLQGDPNTARSRFDAALASDPAEPYALYGELMMARRGAHPERAVPLALDLCERAPAHPLATTAARYILDMTGTAVPMDDAILARVPKALAAGAAGDTAHLLRGSLAAIYGQRSLKEPYEQANADIAVADRFTLVGPFSPFHLLSFDQPTPPEKDGSLQGPFTGPFGPLTLRELPTYGGRISLSGEGPDGDQYILAADLDVPEAADYAVRVVSSTSYKVYLDGTLVAQNRTFERLSPTVSTRAVRLEKGRHRLLMRVLHEDRSAPLVTSVLRVDGKPARITFTPAQGPAPRWSGVQNADSRLLFPAAADLANALRPEAGDAIAEYIAIRDAMGRDRDGSKRLMDALEKRIKGPALTTLRADLYLGDRSVPTRVARGRATRDLEATTDKDPGDVSALITRAVVALEDSRALDAAELLKQARAASTRDGGQEGYPLPLLESRAQLNLNIEAQAVESAIAALKLQPGLCEAQALRYDLARRRDAVKLADTLIAEQQQCPGHLYRDAEHARLRGELDRAISLYEELVARDPGQPAVVSRLASLYVSQRRYADAARRLEALRPLWPRNAGLVKQLADVHELAGKPDVALKLREEALALDGSDLTLRRTVERARTGKEVLAEYAIDTKTAMANYESQRGTEETAYAYVLDAAAIEGFPDGSMVDRIHVIQKALDQSGVADIAEVNLPGGAQVLKLRTLKADGTVLEPENIEGKDSISLPGVQVGDSVEYEYLLAHPARGPIQPGFTASNFYFQIARVPNNWSTYVVIGPKGSGMKVDAHNVQAPQPTVKGDKEVFFHDERRVPPYFPEPDSPQAATEFLPFVAVGAGTTGQTSIVEAYADAYLDHGQITYEVEKFAKEAVAGKKGLEAVKALYAAVMERLSGRDTGLTSTAAASLAQDRGSRMWLIKASLDAVGIPARLAAVRTFATDPAPFVFPNESLLPYVALRVEIPNEGVVWLDPLIRFGPFGELPEQALGEREAYLFPEPARPLTQVKTPPQLPKVAKEIGLQLTLGADGKLSGTGFEKYEGIEAARLAEALDALPPEQRNQALQSALARYFGGAELTSLKLDIVHQVGAPMTVRYTFTAPNFARKEGDSLMLGPITFPAKLGKRYVQVGSRKTPLFIDDTERTKTHVELTLPPGMQMVGPVPTVRSASRYGNFSRQEKVDEKGRFIIDEEYRLDMARIPTKEYEEFAAFAGEVDLVQARDLVVVKK